MLDYYYKNLLLENSSIENTINSNIEKNRKGNFSIKFNTIESVKKVSLKLKSHDFNFGCNTFMLNGFKSCDKNIEYEQKFKRLFNLGVVGTFWKDYEVEKGKYRFAEDSNVISRRPPIDRAVRFCKESGMKVKAHNLIWHNSIAQPDWLNKDRTKIMPDIYNYIEKLGERYKDDFDIIDVANENLCRGEWSRYNPNVSVMPDDYAFKAFKKAAEVFPNSKLFTNENHMGVNINFCDDSSWYYMYLKALLGDGCRVGGIGMQYHLFLSKQHEEWFGLDLLNIDILNRIISLYERFKLPIHISEITIPSTLFGSKIDEGLQRDVAESLFRMWFSHEQMSAIIWWNLADGCAYGNEDIYKGALLNEDLSEKPVYKMLDRLINKEWTTNKSITNIVNNNCYFNGFYGLYDIIVETDKSSYNLQCYFDRGNVETTMELKQRS